MVCEVGNVTRLDVKVLEGLGRGVNDLIVELTLNLIGRHGVPPEEAVQDASQRLENSLGKINVATLLVDLPVDHDGDLRQAVLLGTVQLKCLTCRRVIVQHLLESSTNVDGLRMSVDCDSVSSEQNLREQGGTSLACCSLSECSEPRQA